MTQSASEHPVNHSVLEASQSIPGDGIVSMHQLVLRNQGDGSIGEWIVTGIESTDDDVMITLADPEFSFRITVPAKVFHEKGFIALMSDDGTPVWGY